MVEAGVIEGFYGRPWGDAARLDYAQFLQAHGFSYYIYAPKAEQKLRRQWRDPLSLEQLAQLSDLSARFRACGLKFGVGLTPFELHLDYSGHAKSALRNKLRQLNQIGMDILCILFDDMHGAIPGLAQLQARVVADISAWNSATKIILCPTYYSDDPILSRVFGSPPHNYLEDLGDALDPAISIFWTGAKVCSSGYADQHLEDVAERLGRKPVIWDNHIANDGRERCEHLYLDGLSDGWSLNKGLVEGLAINPMNQPALSRIPLAACARKFADAFSGSDKSDVVSLARSMCGEALGQELAKYLDLFQNKGRLSLHAPERAKVLAAFQRHASDHCAEEVCGWLRGEYQFDPQCLTD
jgi:hyaluronoglucosaminidase